MISLGIVINPLAKAWNHDICRQLMPSCAPPTPVELVCGLLDP